MINSNPCIAYLMEENTITMQALVMAHACYGHNSFFKNNYLFRSWTDASSIVDYLIFARNYITRCEERYGVDEVEKLLDSCHALMNYGVDRYKRPQKISLQEEKARQKSREEYLQSQVNMLWRTLPKREEEKLSPKHAAFPLNRRKTCSILWRKTPRCSSRGSAKFCASCVKSASIFIRRNRRRS